MKSSKKLWVISLALVLSLLAITIPVVPAMAASLSVTPAAGPPGTGVTISGGGYTASSPITVSFQIFTNSGNVSTNVVSANTDSSGSFVVQYTIPNQPGGTYNFTVGSLSTAPFTITPVLSFTTSIGKVGDLIAISGIGFRSDVNVRIYLDSNVVAMPISNDNGTITANFEVPEAAQGKHTMYASDNQFSSPNYDFTVVPKITVSPTSATSGSTIAVSGTGFTAFSSISFTLDGATVGSVISSNNIGSFADVQLTVPVVAAGSHTLKASDSNGNSDSTSITTSQAFTISPASGPATTEIKITGGGFAADKTITVTYNNNPVTTNPSIITSDTDGNFSAVFNAPKTAAGTYNIAASDGTNSSSAQFTLTAFAKVDQTTGAVGSSIPYSGDGFNANATITVQYDGVGIGTTKADASGSFSGTFAVPPGKAGDHKITITDGVNTINATFTTTGAAQIIGPDGVAGAQTSGYVGSDLTVRGNAFVPGATVTITYDSTPVATATVNGDGTFTATFKAPASKGGIHTIIASDGTNKINLSFMMDSTPPLAPTLISPVKNANASALADFQWSPVTDPSGVTYTLQIASDPGFNSIVVQKTGLTTNSYQLTQQEQLNPTGSSKPYYWRVMTIDGASNESPWSTALTFTVGFQFPAWLLYFLIAVGAVIVFAAGFLLGRRSGRYGV